MLKLSKKVLIPSIVAAVIIPVAIVGAYTMGGDDQVAKVEEPRATAVVEPDIEQVEEVSEPEVAEEVIPVAEMPSPIVTQTPVVVERNENPLADDKNCSMVNQMVDRFKTYQGMNADNGYTPGNATDNMLAALRQSLHTWYPVYEQCVAAGKTQAL